MTDSNRRDYVEYLIAAEGMSPTEALSIAEFAEKPMNDSDKTSMAQVLGRGMIGEAAEAHRVVLLAYREKRRLRQLRSTLLVEYWCANRPNRCLLLHCWQSPLGRWIVLPEYRWSPARAAETVDGNRLRPARALNLDDLIEVSKLPLIPLDCNHVSKFVEPDFVLADALCASPGSPRVVRISSG